MQRVRRVLADEEVLNKVARSFSLGIGRGTYQYSKLNPGELKIADRLADEGCLEIYFVSNVLTSGLYFVITQKGIEQINMDYFGGVDY